MSVAPFTTSLPTVSSPIVWKRSPPGEKNLIELVAESMTIKLPTSSIQNEVGFFSNSAFPKKTYIQIKLETKQQLRYRFTFFVDY